MAKKSNYWKAPTFERLINFLCSLESKDLTPKKYTSPMKQPISICHINIIKGFQ